MTGAEAMVKCLEAEGISCIAIVDPEELALSTHAEFEHMVGCRDWSAFFVKGLDSDETEVIAVSCYYLPVGAELQPFGISSLSSHWRCGWGRQYP